MSRDFKLSTSILLLSILIIYGICYLLLHNHHSPCSISFIISHTNHLAIKHRLIILGLIPVYISIVVFGTALTAVYFGSKINTLFE